MFAPYFLRWIYIAASHSHDRHPGKVSPDERPAENDKSLWTKSSPKLTDTRARDCLRRWCVVMLPKIMDDAINYFGKHYYTRIPPIGMYNNQWKKSLRQGMRNAEGVERGSLFQICMTFVLLPLVICFISKIYERVIKINKFLLLVAVHTRFNLFKGFCVDCGLW